jgi:AhpD family alkylhydroperoxidase
MNPRVDITKHISSAPVRALFNLSAETQKRIDPALFHLVEIRASQINGCAYCIDMHTKDARAAGETEQRIYALDAWRETPFFTDTHVPDEVFEGVSKHFNEEELVALTFAVVVINSWNRLSVSFRPEVGSYQPKSVAVHA